MKRTGIVFLALLLTMSALAAKPKLLIFSKTKGFYHASIKVAVPVIYKMAVDNGFEADSTKDASVFNDANLKQYAAIIFVSTTGDLFNDAEKKALEKYVQKGGGIVGIHAATDAEYNWPWYNQLMGAWFMSHPKQQTATLDVVDKKHISTKGLPAKWIRKDEWYDFKNINKDVKVLMTIDEKSYEGGKNGAFHPMAWYHKFDGGRVFYTALGHTDESYSEPLFLKHVWGGILYAAGKKK